MLFKKDEKYFSRSEYFLSHVGKFHIVQCQAGFIKRLLLAYKVTKQTIWPKPMTHFCMKYNI